LVRHGQRSRQSRPQLHDGVGCKKWSFRFDLTRFTPQFPISSHMLPVQGNSHIKIIRRYAWFVFWTQWIGKVCGSPFHGYTGLERRDSLQAFHLRGLDLSVQSLHLLRQRCNDAGLGRPMVTWLYSLNLKSPDRGMIERNPEWTQTTWQEEKCYEIVG
jgi:hypothetical protein